MQARAVLLRKIVNLVITLWAVWTLNFFLFHMLPGDPTHALLPPRVPHDIAEKMKATFGLDKPLLEQYFISLGTALSGDLGYSWFFKKPVLDIILSRLQYTLLLVGTGTFVTMAVGVKLGIIAGTNRGKTKDITIVGTSLAFYAMPAFWLGMILLMTLAGDLDLFPLHGFRSYTGTSQTFVEEIADRLWHMVLPVLTFVLITLSEFVLMMRNALIDVLTEDYITTARATGLTPNVIVRKHAVPNALIPTVATFAMYIGWAVTGAIMIEIVFSWPGVGSLTWQALTQRDFPVLQGVFLIVAVTMLVANLVADIVYTYIDPRVRL